MSEIKVCNNNPRCHAPADCARCDCCDNCCGCFGELELVPKLRARIDYLEGRLAREVKKREECKARYHNLLTGE